MKKMFFLLTAYFLTACSTNVYNSEEDCMDKVPVNERAGVLVAYQLIEETVTYLFTEKYSSKKKLIGGCQISCRRDYTYSNLKVSDFKILNPSLFSLLENSSDRNVCVPKTKACEPSGTASLIGINLSNVFSSSDTDPLIGTLSGLDAAEYSPCSEDEEEPVVCLIGNLLNSNTNSCVPEEISCTSEELDSIGATSGLKMFNTMTNEYNMCQAQECLPDHTLSMGICNPDEVGGGDPDPVFGCMDSRAANFNPEATTDDMSCMCEPTQLPWNPITGCEDMEFGP